MEAGQQRRRGAREKKLNCPTAFERRAIWPAVEPLHILHPRIGFDPQNSNVII
jgi:DNA-binding transcriptional LysR family regulator